MVAHSNEMYFRLNGRWPNVATTTAIASAAPLCALLACLQEKGTKSLSSSQFFSHRRV